MTCTPLCINFSSNTSFNILLLLLFVLDNLHSTVQYNLSQKIDND